MILPQTLIDVYPLIVFILLFWVLVLTFFFFKYISHYARLYKSRKHGVDGLKDAMEALFNENRKSSEAIKELSEKLDNLIKKNSLDINKIGVVRFNPYGDTGGKISFSLALLNSKGDGVVISSLYGRDSSRVYSKIVKGGRGSGFKLSLEEKEAIKKALS